MANPTEPGGTERPASADPSPRGPARPAGSPRPAQRPAGQAPPVQRPAQGAQQGASPTTPPTGQESPAASRAAAGPRDRSVDEPFPSRSRKREQAAAADTRRRNEERPEKPEKRSGRGRSAVAATRNQLANIVRIVFIVLALLLAVGAFLVAVRDNVSNDNAVVRFIWDAADAIDGPFSRDNGIFTFHGKNAVTKDAVVNWGIAAIFYLVVGNILTRFIRPGSRA